MSGVTRAQASSRPASFTAFLAESLFSLDLTCVQVGLLIFTFAALGLARIEDGNEKTVHP